MPTPKEFLSGIAVNAVFTGQGAVFDEWNDGTATSTWTISGTRAGGRAFTVKRSNRWASQDDSTLDPAFDLASATDLLNNDFEQVSIRLIRFSSTMGHDLQPAAHHQAGGLGERRQVHRPEAAQAQGGRQAEGAGQHGPAPSL